MARKIHAADAARNRLETLILGSSHAEFGIRATEGEYNLGGAFQDLYTSFELYKRYADAPKLKRVILTYSVFSPGSDTIMTNSRDCCVAYKVLANIPYRDSTVAEKAELSRYEVLARNKAKQALRKNDTKGLDNRGNILHYWTPFEHAPDEERARDHLKNNDRGNDMSRYLRMMMTETNRRAQELVVVIPPARKAYINALPSRDILFKELDRIEGLRVLDFYGDEHFEDGDFMDPDHLTKDGARKLTALIRLILQPPQRSEPRIPKIIHYVWIGDRQMPELAQKCLASWRRFYPDWEIREWGNDFARGVDNRYVKEALANRKWAFVSDWVRLYALKKFGGVYLDTDMEIVRPIDELLRRRFFVGWETQNGRTLFGTGIIGSEPDGEIVSDLLKLYDKLAFVDAHGELDLTPNTERIVDHFCRNCQLEALDAESLVELGANAAIYPESLLGGGILTRHHFSASWLDPYLRKLKLKIGPYKLLQFKRRKELQGGEIRIHTHERVLATLKLSSRKKIVLVKG